MDLKLVRRVEFVRGPLENHMACFLQLEHELMVELAAVEDRERRVLASNERYH